MRYSSKYPGVFTRPGSQGPSYGIDYVHPITSQRIRKTIKGCKSESQAAEIRHIEIADAVRGSINQAYGIKDRDGAVLFDDMVNEYLELWSKDNKDLRTDRQRAAVLRRHFKGKLMSDINPFAVERFKAAMVKDRARSTVNKYLSLGCQIYEKAREWQRYEGSNPFSSDAVKRFKVPKKKKPGSLSPGDVAAIMAEIRHQVKRDMVAFAYYTGWRISEITGLKWSDVDLKNGRAWIADPKNANPVEVELSDGALAVIRSQGRRSDFVFCHLNGNPFKTGIHSVITEAAKRAGVELPERKAWHIFRRTWASMFLQSGGDVETLRVLGNWRDYSMPMWYADAAGAGHKKRVLNKIPKINDTKMTQIEKLKK